MEKELRARLDKQRAELDLYSFTPATFIIITLATLEAIRAHIIEKYPERFGDSGMLEDTLEVVKDYQ